MGWRHEVKHEINMADMIILRARLSVFMQPDIHGTDGRYDVRSLYFDNMYDKALREKLNGIGKREKFRIRFYNMDTSFIRLEKKQKRDGFSRKESVPVSIVDVKTLMSTQINRVRESQEALLGELFQKMQSQGLRTKTIVEYTREAFTCENGNVRITFDTDIRTGISPDGFLVPDCVTIPVSEHAAILEVKWDSFLPSVIRDALQLTGRKESSFSKYEACRIYG